MQLPKRPTHFVALLCLVLTVGSRVGWAADVASNNPIRIGVTPVFLNYQTSFLNDWQDYLRERLHREVVFVQRNTYRKIIDLMLEEKIEFAWICGYPFLQFRPFLRLMAVPVYRGRPLYQSYLIVPSTDTETRSLLDLRGDVFAYSDPDSNSGYLFTQYSLHQLGENRETFFRKGFFTWAHEKVIQAVASGLADGGAVDGYIWDSLAIIDPDLVARTRIVSKSQEFGFPPLVSSRRVTSEQFEAVEKVLFDMSNDEAGRALLARLNLDGFERGEDGLFDGIGLMKIAVMGQ